MTILANYPVIPVLLGGLIGGVALTQTVKLTYLAFQPGMVSDIRYRVSVYWLATLLTFAITTWLYHAMVHHEGAGLRHVVSVIDGVASPYSYRTAKALVAWKFPSFAAKWGDSRSAGP